MFKIWKKKPVPEDIRNLSEETDIGSIKIAFNMPMEKAVEYLVNKKIEMSANYRNSLKIYQHSFTVTGVMNLEVLKDIKDLLVTTLTTGLNLIDFKKQIQIKFTERGWLNKTEDGKEILADSRLNLIYEQNIRSAYAEGRWYKIINSGDTYFVTDSVMDNSTTLRCAKFDGKIFRTDDKYYAKYLRVPRHFGCRSMETVIPDELAKIDNIASQISDSRDFPINAEGFIRDL